MCDLCDLCACYVILVLQEKIAWFLMRWCMEDLLACGIARGLHVLGVSQSQQLLSSMCGLRPSLDLTRYHVVRQASTRQVGRAL